MKTTFHILLSLPLAVSALAGTPISDDFSTNTTANYTVASQRNNYVYSAAGVGVGGVAGRLNVPEPAPMTGNTDAAWTNEFSAGTFGADTTFAVSYYFLTGALGTGDTTVNIAGAGVGTIPANIFGRTSATGTLHTDLRRALLGTSTEYGFRFKSNDGSTVNGTTTTALSDNTWYQLVFTATRTSTNNFDVSAELMNWGADGLTGGAQILSASTSYTNTTIGDGDPIFGGFFARNTGNTALTPDLAAVDNFSITPPAPPVILSTAYDSATGDFSFEFVSEPQALTVRRSPDLSTPTSTWTLLAPTATGSGETLTYTDTTAAGPRNFYVLIRE